MLLQPAFQCSGLKVNQQEKWTPFNCLGRDYRLELHFTWEITINTMMQNKLVLTHEVWVQPGALLVRVMLAVLFKWWSQSCWSSDPPLDLSSGGAWSPQAKDFVCSGSGGNVQHLPLGGVLNNWWCNSAVSHGIFLGVFDCLNHCSCLSW